MLPTTGMLIDKKFPMVSIQVTMAVHSIVDDHQVFDLVIHVYIYIYYVLYFKDK